MAVIDDDDKIRRNVVVASSVVLVSAWLGISGTGLSEKLYGLAGIAAPAWKLWVVTLVVLVYLGLRYRWSTEVTEAIQDFKKSQDKHYERLFRTVFIKRVSAGIVTGEFAREMHPQLAMNVSVALRHLNQQMGNPKSARPGSFAVEPTSAEHQINWTLTWHREAGEPYIQGVLIVIPIHPKQWRRFHWSARARAYAYSKGAMDLTIPVVLLSCAFAVTGWRLAASLFC